MKTAFGRLLLCAAISFVASLPGQENPAMNTPDKVAWQLFLQVNARAGDSNALFETWASDTHTFQLNPQFPSTPSPLDLHAPILFEASREAILAAGGLLPQLPPDPNVKEESRRNQEAFNFIVGNRLHLVSGLRAGFGKSFSFPPGAIEVKANWEPVENIPAFTLNRVSAADVPKMLHVNTAPNGKQYALLSMHIISKQVPNWTWATFENAFNPKRCDVLGCIDNFGALIPRVDPHSQLGTGYDVCAKSSALSHMIAAVDWDPAFANYCLKGSQTDFTDNSGLATRLGNSITESTFVAKSSCITCHGRAAWGADGKQTSGGGFDASGAPLGSILPLWFWNFSSTPPIFQGMPGLQRKATSADFVWSIPFCAFDDTANPQHPSRCAGK